MIKKIACVGIFTLLFYGNAFAEFFIYTIDGKFDAVFPAKPQFTGEIGEGDQKHRSYNYTDENSLIVYTATYQVGRAVYAKKDIPEALSNYVKGQALVVGGGVDTYTPKVINGNSSATFVVKYQYQGVPVKKYGVVSYKDGHFYQWAVQDFPSMSKLSGENIFRSYLVNFVVK